MLLSCFIASCFVMICFTASCFTESCFASSCSTSSLELFHCELCHCEARRTDMQTDTVRTLRRGGMEIRLKDLKRKQSSMTKEIENVSWNCIHVQCRHFSRFFGQFIYYIYTHSTIIVHVIYQLALSTVFLSPPPHFFFGSDLGSRVNLLVRTPDS